jgi:cation transport regulator ChaB
MPYSTIADLPAGIRKAYSPRCQGVFAKVFNAQLEAHGDEGRAMAVGHVAAKKCMEGNAMQPVKATVLDDDSFRLLAIPFGGPIPQRDAPRGVDLDGEWFSPRTDIKPAWFDTRLVDWHHGHDDLMGRAVLGKAVDLGPFGGAGDEPDEDGWWVTVWLAHGERRVDLVKKLAERGAKLYGSSESVAGLVQKARSGEILSWPYVRQTLSTSPQNTYSVLRPLKATLDDYLSSGLLPSAAFWADTERAMRDLGASLRDPSLRRAIDGAKSGRVLSGVNESALRDALDVLDVALGRLREVVSRQTPTKQED